MRWAVCIFDFFCRGAQIQGASGSGHTWISLHSIEAAGWFSKLYEKLFLSAFCYNAQLLSKVGFKRKRKRRSVCIIHEHFLFYLKPRLPKDVRH
jgi:hypothetical protein